MEMFVSYSTADMQSANSSSGYNKPTQRILNFQPNYQQQEQCNQILNAIESDVIRGTVIKCIDGLSCKI